jgi:single-strand DNA-binding protein
MNFISVMGRLTKDPETSTSQGGKMYSKYTIDVDRKYKVEGQQETDFFPCISFGKQAEFVQHYLTKGTKVIISGEMNLDVVEKDGKKTTYPKIKVNEIEFAESKKTETKSDDYLSVSSDTDLPF